MPDEEWTEIPKLEVQRLYAGLYGGQIQGGNQMAEVNLDVSAELERLKAENAALKASAGPKPLALKVSEKGACSLYGLGRFPTTLYKQQWERVLDFTDQIRACLVAHEKELKTKE